jgi:hypothetical protein
MLEWWEKNFANCTLGDLRLSKRALEIGRVLSLGFGKALSELFAGANELKRAYEFLPTRRQNLPRSLDLTAK